jgi:hemolysin activation/secretion protein
MNYTDVRTVGLVRRTTILRRYALHAMPGILVTALAGIAHAQTPPRPDGGSILREQTQPRLELPARPAPEISVDQPVRPALKPSAARFVLKNLRISGNTVFPADDLLALVREQVGREIGFADLDAITARIARFYRERGYLVARAYLPAQDIKDGDVEIAVIEGRFGKVSINNSSLVRDSVIHGHLDHLAGRPVHGPALERKLLLLDDLAGVGDARTGLKAGSVVGESDMTVTVTPAPRFSGALDYDNHGNRYTGMHRVSGSVNIASPLGLGDQLGLRATHGFNGFDYGRLHYQLPLGGDGFKLGAAYGANRYQLSRPPFDATVNAGDSETWSLTASYPLIRGQALNL